MENEIEKKVESEKKERNVLNDDYINEIITGLIDFARGRETRMRTYSEKYEIDKEDLNSVMKEKIEKLDQEVKVFNEILQKELLPEEKEIALKNTAQKIIQQLLEGQSQELIDQRIGNLLEMYQDYREMLKRKQG